MATTIRTTKRGRVTAIDGSAELNGSKETVTECRLATANTTKIRPSGINSIAVKNLRIFPLALLETGGVRSERALLRPTWRAKEIASGSGFGSFVLAVQPLTHFLPGLEKRDALLVDWHMGPGARITAGAGRAVLDRERAEATKLNAVAAGQGRHDLIKDRVHDVLDIPLVEMRIVLGDTRDKFGFNHRDWYPGTAGMHFRENALNCQDAKSIFGDAKWTASAQARPIVAVPPGEAGRGNRPKASIADGGLPQSKHPIEA